MPNYSNYDIIPSNMPVEKRGKSEQLPTVESAWLLELSHFIVEANTHTWAGDGVEVPPQRPGYKELEYKRGDWYLRDSYTGYFRAPGMTTVYYNEIPVWTQSYGGTGMAESHYPMAEPTFQFLRAALKRVTPELPFRGPKEFTRKDFRYRFHLDEGDITDFAWRESISYQGIAVFLQRGFGGLVVHKTRQPIQPWETAK